ncbi:hypothetical protein VQ643_16235 [Pseudomonas sp. F1_0610]|uniref:hypothetical protein n=1 Tax=Pseudomonas sp. F1_0610 TaxID=3114284 RepID=UPI0039C3C668
MCDIKKEKRYTKSKKEKQYILGLLESKKFIYETEEGKRILSQLSKEYGGIPKTGYSIFNMASQGYHMYRWILDGEYSVFFTVDNETQEVDDIMIDKITDNYTKYDKDEDQKARTIYIIAVGLSRDDIAELDVVDRGGVEKNKQ